MIEVTVVQSVTHDRHDLHQGDTVKLPASVAKQLRDAGFVVYGEPEEEAAPAVEEKQADAPENKMLDDAENKAATKPAKSKAK